METKGRKTGIKQKCTQHNLTIADKTYHASIVAQQRRPEIYQNVSPTFFQLQPSTTTPNYTISLLLCRTSTMTKIGGVSIGKLYMSSNFMQYEPYIIFNYFKSNVKISFIGTSRKRLCGFKHVLFEVIFFNGLLDLNIQIQNQSFLTLYQLDRN